MIAGGVGNNGLGVSGVCQSGIKIISAKFLGPNGGYTSDAVAALQYLLALRNRYSLNLVATSNSWGGGGYSQVGANMMMLSLFWALLWHCPTTFAIPG
jgi:hypothetical protein